MSSIGQRLGMLGHGLDLLGQFTGCELVLPDRPGAACSDYLSRISSLVIVSRDWQRHEDRRPAYGG